MKIDTSKIEGYSDMSAEDKVAALEALEINDNADELARQKQAVTNATKEAAEFKRQLKALQEQQSSGKTDAEKSLADLQARFDALQKEKTISDYTAQYVAQGYAAELAADTAKALADGDTAKVFANQKQFLDDREKQIRAEILKGTPAPQKGGRPPEGITKEKLKKMSFQERMEYASKYPEEYKKLYEGG